MRALDAHRKSMIVRDTAEAEAQRKKAEALRLGYEAAQREASIIIAELNHSIDLAVQVGLFATGASTKTQNARDWSAVQMVREYFEALGYVVTTDKVSANKGDAEDPDWIANYYIELTWLNPPPQARGIAQ